MKRLAAGFLLLVLLLGCSSPRAPHGRNDQGGRGKAVLRVFIVRHAEAYKNIPHPPGTSEEKLDSLIPRGHKQAAALGRFLKGKGVVAVITSPTGRTRETGDAIGAALVLDKRYSENEAFASLKKGETPDGQVVSWSWREEQWNQGHDPRPEGGESLADGVARATSAIDEVAREYPGKAVAIVSHGDICAALLGQAVDTPVVKRYKLHNVAAGSASEITITDSGWYLLSQGVNPPFE